MSVFEETKIKISDLGENDHPPILFKVLLIGLGVFAYFTGSTVVPFLVNNIGFFEVTVVLLGIVAFLFFLRNRLKIRFHITNIILYLIVVIAVLSLPNLADRLSFGLIQFFLLVYNTFFVLLLFNILLQFPSLIRHLLRFIMIGGLIAGTWVLTEGIRYNAPIGTAGPFRNRAHVGIYMLSSFWMVITYLFWPSVSKFERVLAIITLSVVLYALAVSGRRSVYLSLFIGIAFLGLGFLITRGVDRFKLSLAVVLAGGTLYFLAQIGSQYVPQLDFFNDRIGLIDDRIELAAGTGDEIEGSDNFAVLQRQGMFQAVADHPLIGIGWGGFYDSKYSPTGHEMHSTPQRFLAELGIIGFLLYLIFNFYLWFGSVRLFLRLRHTKYQIPALIFMVAIWSLSVSWAYNRSVTERTYWLLIVLFISFESLVNIQFAKQGKSALGKWYRRTSYYPQPEPGHTPPVLPLSQD